MWRERFQHEHDGGAVLRGEAVGQLVDQVGRHAVGIGRKARGDPIGRLQDAERTTVEPRRHAAVEPGGHRQPQLLVQARPEHALQLARFQKAATGTIEHLHRQHLPFRREPGGETTCLDRICGGQRDRYRTVDDFSQVQPAAIVIARAAPPQIGNRGHIHVSPGRRRGPLMRADDTIVCTAWCTIRCPARRGRTPEWRIYVGSARMWSG